MTESQDAAGYHLGIVHDAVPNTASDVHLPKFVGMQQEKTTMGNGRHVVNYYLVDEFAGEHLAVIGEEKDTKDGHYLYRTVGVFHLIAPLEAHNQADVQSWIDMMTHEGPPPPGNDINDGSGGGGGGKHHQQKKKDAAATDDGTTHHHTRHQSTKTHQRPGGSGTTATATPHSAPAVTYSQHRQYHPYQRRGAGRASGGGAKVGRPAGSAGGSGLYHHPHYPGTGGGGHSDLFRQATTNLQRKAGAGGAAAAGGGGWKGKHTPDQEVRDVVSLELRRWAGEEAYLRDVLANQALAFIDDTDGSSSGLSDEDGGIAERCLGVLKKASKAGGGGGGGSGGRAAAAAGQEAQRAVISALRELIHMPASLPLISMPEMKETVNTLTKHSNRHIAGLATDLLTMWLKATVTQLSVLVQPMYTQDAKSTLERTVIGDKSVLDPIVSQIAHRPIHPPPPPPSNASSLLHYLSPSRAAGAGGGAGGGTWRGVNINNNTAAAGGVVWSPARSYGGVDNSPSAFATPASTMMMEEEPSGSLMNVDEGFMMMVGAGEHHHHHAGEGGDADDVDITEDVGIEGAQVLRHPLPADIADNL